MKLSTLLSGLKENPWVTAFNIAVLHFVYHWYLMGYMPTGLFGLGVTMSVSILLFFTVIIWFYSDKIAKAIGL